MDVPNAHNPSQCAGADGVHSPAMNRSLPDQALRLGVQGQLVALVPVKARSTASAKSAIEVNSRL